MSWHKAAIIAAARELLHATPASGAIFEIPGLVPRHLIVLPTEPLNWNEPEEGEPRRWTILVTSAGHGLVGEPGAKFPHAEAKHERGRRAGGRAGAGAHRGVGSAVGRKE